MWTLFCDAKIKLESSVIKIADGTFINADKIEFMRKFCRKLLDFILGELMPNNQRKGKYIYAIKMYSIESLARIEQELGNATDEKDARNTHCIGRSTNSSKS